MAGIGNINTIQKESGDCGSKDCKKDKYRPCCEDKLKNRIFFWNDFTKIAILMLLSLVLGIYLTPTTVMISKDGVFYIERAQQLTTNNNSIEIIKAHPPGYPFLILMGHKFIMLFNATPSVFTWIHSAQSVTLLCRVLAIIPLYLMGKLLVGNKNSFWAILILIFLPFTTRMVCDVVREWPYLLFLAIGFFFLLWGAKYGKWWALGAVGLSSGLGYLIRPESIQLVVYGFLWIATTMLKPKLWNVSRRKGLIGLALLVIGFAIPAVPYIRCTGEIVPPQATHVMKSLSFNASSDKPDEPKLNYNTAEIVPGNVLNAFGEIFKKIGENLMWFFMPLLGIGLYYQFRGNAEPEELFLMTVFVLANITMVVFRYCCIQHTVSQRWVLPLTVFTIFYIPVGLRIIGNWLESRFPLDKKREKKKWLSWFVVLFLIGIGICIPKLFRPIRIEKQGYRDAARWLGKNTAPADIIAVPDSRIAFYAERKGLIWPSTALGQAKYIVKIVTDEDKCQTPEFNGVVQKFRGLQEKYSVWADKRNKERKKIVIYEVMR